MPGSSRKIAVTPGGRTDFTIHQLVVFRTVATHLSYTRAAEVLYLSQPAVTQQVRTLEQMIGLRLFARSGRGIVLTPAGQELLHHAEHLLALVGETASVVREIHALRRGSVTIGASTSAGTYVVPPLLGAFHAHYPRIHVTLVVANRRSIEQRLLDHQLDLAVMSLIERREWFVVESLMPYELIVVAAPSHPLVNQKNLALSDLQEETLLLREHESATRLATEQLFAEAHVLPQHSLELENIEVIKEGVIAGLGIAIVSRESVALEIADGDLVPLDVQHFPLRREWFVIHLKERRLSLAADALRQQLLHKPVGSPSPTRSP
jgi:DNA-binding transcriptional LysR family regulator